MSFDYSELAATALELLTEFGGDVTRRSYTAGVYDPATGLVTPTTADTTRQGALFDFGAGKTLERGTLIQAGDKQLLLDATATVSPQDSSMQAGLSMSSSASAKSNQHPRSCCTTCTCELDHELRARHPKVRG